MNESSLPEIAGARLLHIGIAVRDAAAAARAWAAVGLATAHIEEVAGEAVRVAFLPAGEAELELLEPLSPDNVIAKFIERRGEGIHHMALQVPDLEAALAAAARQGYNQVGKGVTTGARGSRVAFLSPKDFNGVLVELVDPAP
ncbi:MAG: methylmalonyl-CoA epimerase [Armatimonadetes bacterium]|nr:methylmalonyl-CoA epimerase [Armatimonadota bacterium]